MAWVNLSTAYIGQFFIWLVFLFSTIGIFYTQQRRFWWISSFILLTCSFSLLFYAHIVSDFSYVNVALNSNVAEPLFYKIAGVWGNHEGSFLLWVWLLSLYSFLVMHQKNEEISILVMGVIQSSFIFLLILACNPFEVMETKPLDGLDLNPALQDVSLLFHPPFLYCGLVGCSVPFAFSFEALIQKTNLPKNTHVWVLNAWIFLTTGLLLGSFWAYYELGWGGFWFWDPVENLGLMPWLTLTTLLHTLREKSLGKISMGLGLLTFVLCLIMLFFVRSGILTSVHSFAVDESRGLLLGALMLTVTTASAFVFVLRRRHISVPKHAKTPRLFLFEGFAGFMGIGVFILLFSIVTPLICSVFNMSITLGPDYFQKTFLPFSMPILLFMLFVPFLKNVDVMKQDPSILVVVLIAVLGMLWFSLKPSSDILATIGFGLSTALFIVSCLYGKKGKIHYARDLAHGGLGVLLMGAILSTYMEETVTFPLMQKNADVAGYSFVAEKNQPVTAPYYESQKITIFVKKGSDKKGVLTPEIRFHKLQNTYHHETSLLNDSLSQLYAVCAADDQGQIFIQISYKPWINLLWIGGFLMVLGGTISMLRIWKKRTSKNLFL
jgi:cytochrome c-type biogenesis protein CcmF